MILRVRTSLALPLGLALLAACGPAREATTPAERTPAIAATTAADAIPAPEPEIDPVAVGMTAAGITKLCDDNLAKAQAHVTELESLKGAPAERLTWDATVGRVDDVMLALGSAAELPYLMGVAHPNGVVREAAKLCEPKTDRFQTALWLNADLAAVIRAYAAKGDRLTAERARLLSDTLRDFRRNGLELDGDGQRRLRELNEELTRLGQEFLSNISRDATRVEVKPSALKGLPKEYIASHRANTRGLVEISTDYPDYFPFVTYSADRKAALEVYVAFTNRGGDDNVRLLERLLTLRHDKARLLGYATWADYAIEPRMAKTADGVRDFLAKISATIKGPAQAELADFISEHVKLGGKATDKLLPPDRYYLEDRVRQQKYSFDSQQLSAYLEVSAVKDGLLEITAQMFGLKYRQAPADAWHEDVTAYEVLDATDGKLIGTIYLDLYPRPHKYKHAAMFPIRTPKLTRRDRWREPIAALVCNFPKPGAQAALMKHDDVVTFFHEFGHVLHHLFTRSTLATYAGTATVRDFVEAPSQVLEEWAWSRETLNLFARHHQTGERIPDALFASMQKARGFGRALVTQRQVFLATLDHELHTRVPPFDTTKALEEIQAKTDSFTYVRGTHFQSSFGHLIGYDAAYYGYQWALALSRDALTRFKKDGLLNTATAAAWRTDVLAKGGSEDERSLVAKFLGREPNLDAYTAYLQGKD